MLPVHMSAKFMLYAVVIAALTCSFIDAGASNLRGNAAPLHHTPNYHSIGLNAPGLRKKIENDGLANTANGDAVKLGLVNPAVGNSEDTTTTTTSDKETQDDQKKRLRRVHIARSKRRAPLSIQRRESEANKGALNTSNGGLLSGSALSPALGNSRTTNTTTSTAHKETKKFKRSVLKYNIPNTNAEQANLGETLLPVERVARNAPLYEDYLDSNMDNVDLDANYLTESNIYNDRPKRSVDLLKLLEKTKLTRNKGSLNTNNGSLASVSAGNPKVGNAHNSDTSEKRRLLTANRALRLARSVSLHARNLRHKVESNTTSSDAEVGHGGKGDEDKPKPVDGETTESKKRLLLAKKRLRGIRSTSLIAHNLRHHTSNSTSKADGNKVDLGTGNAVIPKVGNGETKETSKRLLRRFRLGV